MGHNNAEQYRQAVRAACEQMARGLSLVEDTPRHTPADDALQIELLNNLRDALTNTFGLPPEFLNTLRAYNQKKITLDDLETEFVSCVRRLSE